MQRVLTIAVVGIIVALALVFTFDMVGLCDHPTPFALHCRLPWAGR
jgi:hypothetical protein